MALKIEQRWSKYFPPLDDESTLMLETSLLDEGQRDPIVCTQQGTVIDGHRRLELLTRHGIAPEVVEMTFESDAEVEEWILTNQLGRRNLSPKHRLYTRGRLVEVKTQGLAKADRGAGPSPGSPARAPTTEESAYTKAIAEIAGDEEVTQRTLRKNRRSAAAIDKLAPAARASYMASDKTLSVAKLTAIAGDKPRAQVKAMREALEPPEPVVGSRAEFLEHAKGMHREALQCLTRVRAIVKELHSHTQASGYLSGSVTRIEELTTDLRSYILTGAPVKWTGERWTTKLEEKQRAAKKPKAGAK